MTTTQSHFYIHFVEIRDQYTCEWEKIVDICEWWTLTIRWSNTHVLNWSGCPTGNIQNCICSPNCSFSQWEQIRLNNDTSFESNPAPTRPSCPGFLSALNTSKDVWKPKFKKRGRRSPLDGGEGTPTVTASIPDTTSFQLPNAYVQLLLLPHS